MTGRATVRTRFALLRLAMKNPEIRRRALAFRRHLVRLGRLKRGTRSLQQKLRAFAQLQLGGIIPWEAFKFPDTVNSDVSRCVIEGKHGEYRITVTSSYTAPPLGRVVFADGDTAIEDVNQDAVWHRIAEHLKARETGDPMLPVESAPAPAVVVPITHNPLAVPERAFVYYWAEAGAWYQNGPAMVTRVNRDGSYNLVVFPENSEPVHRERVGKKSDRLQHICWEEYPGAVAERPSDELAALREELAELKAQVAELSAKRGPGRPPNSAKVA